MHKTVFRDAKYRGYAYTQNEFEEICMSGRIKVEHSTVNGVYEPPRSKSWTHRGLVLSLLADGESFIRNPLISDDTNATLACIEKLGARISKLKDSEWKITGGKLKNGNILNAYNSGTTLRLMMAVCALIEGKTKLLGDSSLDKRPVDDIADALQQLGAKVAVYYSEEEKRRVIEVKGKITSGKVRIKKLYSSQALSALILTLPLLEGESVITVDNLLSLPYVKLTIELAKKAGASIEISQDYRRFRIIGNTKYKPLDIDIPIDFSSIAYPICSCILSGERLEIKNIGRGTYQADEFLLDFLPSIGADLKFSESTLVVKGPYNLKEFSVYLRDCPDLFPPLCIVASMANGVSRLYGASHLVYKECNRIDAMNEILNSVGIMTEKRPDGLDVFGNPKIREIMAKKRVKVDACNDHRIAMSAFILGMVLESGIEIENADCISTSYPKFLEDMKGLGAKYHVLR